jgi:hypothetical protein
MDQIDRLLEMENKIDVLIEQGKKINRLMELSNNQWKEQLQMRGDDKDEKMKKLNYHSERIEQLIERIDTLLAEPLAYYRSPQSLEPQYTSDQVI